jgi:hypothetical protein
MVVDDMWWWREDAKKVECCRLGWVDVTAHVMLRIGRTMIRCMRRIESIVGTYTPEALWHQLPRTVFHALEAMIHASLFEQLNQSTALATIPSRLRVNTGLFPSPDTLQLTLFRFVRQCIHLLALIAILINKARR